MLKNIDQNTIAVAVGTGTAMGAGLFVALHNNPLGFVAGLGLAITIVVGRTRNNRQDKS